MTQKQNVSLLPFNTFGIDVKADYLLEYRTVEELREFLQTSLAQRERILHTGRGSNLLFLSDFKGVVLHSQINFIETVEENSSECFLRVGAGVVWDDFVLYCVENELYGAENLSLIPGETGAAAVQNIGAYGVEIKDLIHRVETVDIQTGNVKFFENADCRYAYRESIFKTTEKRRYIITAVVFRLSRRPVFNLHYAHLESEIKQRYGTISLQTVRAAIIAIREEKLPNPSLQGNAGSFFKNPYVCREHFRFLQKQYPDIPYYAVNDDVVKIPAAWLIERCGWRGKTMGKAAVHAGQPLVLVNTGGAAGNDILRLAMAVQNDVKQQFDIVLEAEVEFIGEK